MRQAAAFILLAALVLSTGGTVGALWQASRVISICPFHGQACSCLAACTAKEGRDEHPQKMCHRDARPGHQQRLLTGSCREDDMALSFGFRAILAPELAQIVRPAASFNFLKPPTFEDDWTTDPLEPPPRFPHRIHLSAIG